MSYRYKTFSEYSSSANENKYKFNAVELKRLWRRTPTVAQLPANCTNSLLSISIITMKLFRIVYITFLAASGAGAGATRAMTALPPQISCIGPCISSKESLNCPSGTSPSWMVTCWRCCGQAG
ncbi:uncharacterized protein HD556DRAFT_1307219 [Suillus plorans]|uniref:Uncharacterized protein n=1 Tax=Suillus plorans TaxID=116603 RepID=A0A9P7DJN6_9AGAM|nr:uncharacterized protein HD556DRAFT_1307219 [Suillus plorans]KAG1796000.1 hypothetical protein HD556DRAFT_1307219 [Suillus plorans]